MDGMYQHTPRKQSNKCTASDDVNWMQHYFRCGSIRMCAGYMHAQSRAISCTLDAQAKSHDHTCTLYMITPVHCT